MGTTRSHAGRRARLRRAVADHVADVAERPAPTASPSAGRTAGAIRHRRDQRDECAEAGRARHAEPSRPRSAQPARVKSHAASISDEHDQHVRRHQLCARRRSRSPPRRPAAGPRRYSADTPDHRRERVDVERPDPAVDQQQVVGGHQRRRAERRASGPPPAARTSANIPRIASVPSTTLPSRHANGPSPNSSIAPGDDQLGELRMLGVGIVPERRAAYGAPDGRVDPRDHPGGVDVVDLVEDQDVVAGRAARRSARLVRSTRPGRRATAPSRTPSSTSGSAGRAGAVRRASWRARRYTYTAAPWSSRSGKRSATTT